MGFAEYLLLTRGNTSVPHLDNFLNHSETSICIRNEKNEVVFQNDPCIDLCQNMVGSLCSRFCDNTQSKTLLKRPAGTRYIPNVKIKNNYFDIFSLHFDSTCVSILYRLPQNEQALETHIATFNLSNRETDIINYVRSGYTNKEIAKTLGISTDTIRSHLKKIYAKLPAEVVENILSFNDRRIEQKQAFNRKPKILMLDNDAEILEMLAFALSDAYSVISHTDPKAALKLISRHQYDLIITDLEMPGSSGKEIFKSARKFQPETPVILMTVRDKADPQVLSMVKAGVDNVFYKPFCGETLLLYIQNLLQPKA